MNRAEVETFRRRVRDLREKYKHDLEQIERDFARLKGISWEDLKGRGREIALEIHARTYIIDPLLRELGWDIADPTTVVVEDRVRPVGAEAEDNRRFLDYHGRVNTEGRSLVIAEAKRPNAALPNPDKGDTLDFIAKALTTIHTANPKGEKLPGKWQEWLSTLIDYIKRTKDQFGHAPVRVVICNGEWFVIFNDVEATLLSKKTSPGNIIVFKNLKDVEVQAEKFYDLLNYPSVSGHIPPQHPSALPEFISTGEEVLCAHVVDVFYTRHGARQPSISIKVEVLVRSTRGAWVIFYKDYDEQFIPLYYKQEILQRYIDELEKRSKDLLKDLTAHCQIKLLTAAEFEKLRKAELAESEELVKKDKFVGGALFRERGSQLVGSVEIRECDGETYRITVGDNFMYFSIRHGYEGCPFHNWGDCRRDGNAISPNGVFAPCSDPRALFPSGSIFHCAHASVHNARKNICVLVSFEEYLCCRCCTFFQRCWPEGGRNLPCREH